MPKPDAIKKRDPAKAAAAAKKKADTEAGYAGVLQSFTLAQALLGFNQADGNATATAAIDAIAAALTSTLPDSPLTEAFLKIREIVSVAKEDPFYLTGFDNASPEQTRKKMAEEMV